MFDYLKDIDHALFSAINGWHSLAWDRTIIFISDKSWFIVLAMIIVAAFYKLKKHFWIVLLTVGLAWGLADLSSTRIFKNNVKRLRPCHSMRHKDAYVPHPEGCGGSYGFVSSHAANSAAVATILFLIFGYGYGLLAFLWVLLVCYTRIYLGKHYPADLLCGMMVGILCGLFVYRLVFIKLKNRFIATSSNV